MLMTLRNQALADSGIRLESENDEPALGYIPEVWNKAMLL
jgi:hypothetical protein